MSMRREMKGGCFIVLLSFKVIQGRRDGGEAGSDVVEGVRKKFLEVW